MGNAVVAGYRNPTPASLNAQQALNQIVFLLCGKLFLHIGVTWAEIAAAVVCGAIVDNVALRVRLGAWQPFNVPSLVAPFAVCIMLRSDRPWVLPLAATVGILAPDSRPVRGGSCTSNGSFSYYGTQTLRFCEPPPLERHEKALFALRPQKVFVSPASALATTVDSQLRKQSFWPVLSKGEHTCGKPVLHSPGTAQQSESVTHVCVQ